MKNKCLYLYIHSLMNRILGWEMSDIKGREKTRWEKGKKEVGGLKGKKVKEEGEGSDKVQEVKALYYWEFLGKI